MVSLQASLSQEERKAVRPSLEIFFSSSSKKRKWQEEGDVHDGESKEPKLWKKEQVEFHHRDAPLPLEWQRCLDIKSGQIHFYNTRTHKRTSKDPRSSPEPQRPSLDLELNLNSTTNLHVDQQAEQVINPNNNTVDRDQYHHDWHHHNKSSKSSSPSSWISLDVNDQQQEMVAAVCLRCHMLVMMCKATPSCPNCKFVHPQGLNSSSSSRNNNKPQSFRLLCCKD